MSLKISPIRLFVPSVRDSFLFYRDILGLQVLHGTEETPYAEFLTGDIRLALEPPLTGDGLAAMDRRHEFCASDRMAVIIKVDDVDAAYKELRDKKIPFVKEPHDTPEWGHRVAYLRDPAGNLIELNAGL